MSWSKLFREYTQNDRNRSTLAGYAIDIMERTENEYHDMIHIHAMFDWLLKNKVPYSRNLDYSIWYHDVVYDDQGSNEYRSGSMFLDRHEETKLIVPYHCLTPSDAIQINSLIIGTMDHSINNDETETDHCYIIKADLSGLTNSVNTFINYGRILEESRRLYNISSKQCAEANIVFMTGLRETMMENYNVTNDPFWIQVVNGIEQTINISKGILQI